MLFEYLGDNLYIRENSSEVRFVKGSNYDLELTAFNRQGDISFSVKDKIHIQCTKQWFDNNFKPFFEEVEVKVLPAPKKAKSKKK